MWPLFLSVTTPPQTARPNGIYDLIRSAGQTDGYLIGTPLVPMEGSPFSLEMLFAIQTHMHRLIALPSPEGSDFRLKPQH